MNSIALLSIGDRRELFVEAAARRGIGAPVIIEKDFWVCWVLSRLFSGTGHAWPAMIFKGGTSLSKAYGVIERFSEDIDLSINRETFGFIDDDELRHLSGKKRDSALDELSQRAASFVMGELLDKLTRDFSSVLTDIEGAWTLHSPENLSMHTSLQLVFEYPKSLDSSAYGIDDYIRPSVLLEFGARSDPWPHESRLIRPYAADVFPEQFPTAECIVDTLGIERTFWEKATILHAEYHRPTDRPLPGRHSRHYYDMAMLSQSAYGDEATARSDLREAVVSHKSLFFKTPWARYDLAQAPTFKLVPPPERIELLRGDYRRTSEMFFGEAPELNQILATLGRLENQINGSK